MASSAERATTAAPVQFLARRSMRATLSLTAAVLLATGCAPSPQPEPAPTQSAATPTGTATDPTGPVLVPDGSAEDNLLLFTTVAQSVWESPQNAQGRAYVDALVAAGYDKGAMQVTQDASTIGSAAETLQFSVQWGEDCLLGQVGPVTGALVTAVAPALAGGGCLLGETRPIDW